MEFIYGQQQHIRFCHVGWIVSVSAAHPAGWLAAYLSLRAKLQTLVIRASSDQLVIIDVLLIVLLVVLFCFGSANPAAAAALVGRYLIFGYLGLRLRLGMLLDAFLRVKFAF